MKAKRSRFAALDVPPAWAQIEIGYKGQTLLAEAFNAETVGQAILALQNMLDEFKKQRRTL